MEKGWKEVLLTRDEVRASMAKDILINEGIPAVVLNQKDSSYLTFGDLAVYVPEASEEKAFDLIKDLKD